MLECVYLPFTDFIGLIKSKFSFLFQKFSLERVHYHKINKSLSKKDLYIYIYIISLCTYLQSGKIIYYKPIIIVTKGHYKNRK